jgi:phage baseplate assembly protein W
MAKKSFDYIGRGWAFPVLFNKQAKLVNMSDDVDDINESLWILLNTARGERVMLPNYGCDMREMLFEPMDTNNITFIKDRIQQSINLYESRIEVLKINLLTDELLEGRIKVVIDYQVKATNSRYNIVFPFYKNEATEIDALGITM